MKTSHLLGASCAFLALSALPAFADVQLVDYAMTAPSAAINSSVYMGATSSAANVTATSLADQSGNGTTNSFTYNNGTNRVSSWTTIAASSAATFADAYSKGSYLTFSITPAAGYALNLTSISFSVASGSASASDRAFYLVTADSPSGFSSSSTVLSTDRTTTGGGAIPLQSGSMGISTVPQNYSVTLTGLTNLTSTQYFRFYLQTPTASQSLTFDDIIVNGTVTASAIPEPSTYALFAGSLLFVGALWRRRRV